MLDVAGNDQLPLGLRSVRRVGLRRRCAHRPRRQGQVRSGLHRAGSRVRRGRHPCRPRRNHDEYRCFMQAQGFGGVRGCGVLVDREGDDIYDANDKDIRYPSPQDAKHNTSLAQGFAFGLRDHPGAGNSLAGGVGILVDGKGNDRYSCGVFGQGVSYWYGLGMLIDMEGDDEYTGIWYCQGSGAHYGVGAIVDMAGNDKYLTKLTMGQGAGHDYSTAWFHDASGNDTYECPGNCVGFAATTVSASSGTEPATTSTRPAAAFGATGGNSPRPSVPGPLPRRRREERIPQGRSRPSRKASGLQPAKKRSTRSRTGWGPHASNRKVTRAQDNVQRPRSRRFGIFRAGRVAGLPGSPKRPARCLEQKIRRQQALF